MCIFLQLQILLNVHQTLMLPMMFKTMVLHYYGLKKLSSFLKITPISIDLEIPHDVTKLDKNDQINELAKMTNL